MTVAHPNNMCILIFKVSAYELHKLVTFSWQIIVWNQRFSKWLWDILHSLFLKLLPQLKFNGRKPTYILLKRKPQTQRWVIRVNGPMSAHQDSKPNLTSFSQLPPQECNQSKFTDRPCLFPLGREFLKQWILC